MKMGQVIDLGITGEKYKHYFLSSSPFFLRVAEFIRAGGAVRHTRKAEVYEQQEEKDVEFHFVSRAIKEEAQFIREAGMAEKAEENLGLDEIFMYFHIVKAVAHFISALDKFLDATQKSGSDIFKRRVRDMALAIVPKLLKGIKEAENGESEDMRFLYGIINDASEKGSGQFVMNLRTSFKERRVKNRIEQMLERRDLRKNIRRQYTFKVDVERLAKELEVVDLKLLKEEQRKKGRVKEETLNRALNRFQKVLPREEEEIVQMFRAAHLVLRRDIILMAIVLGDEQALKALGTGWVRKHFMPNDPIVADNTKITKLELELGKKVHVIANGLNVIMKKIKELEPRVEITLNRAIKIAA